MTRYVPQFGPDITAALANRVVLEALSSIARRCQDAREGTTWNPVRRCSTVADRGTAWAGPAEPDNQLSDTVLNH